ncbi:MAG: ABC transporter permease [Chloroflexota bacterium]
MKIFESFKIAIRALAANKLRSVLTMLGIIIGVSAVIALMSIGRGVEKYVTDQFAGLGSNLLFITAGEFDDGPPSRRRNVEPLTLSDAQAIADPLNVREITAVTTQFISQASVSRGKRTTQTTINAITPSYDEVRNWEIAIGDFINEKDFDERGRVAVLGADTYKDFFGPTEYPLEQTILINNLLFRVIGVLEAKGGGPGGGDDDSVFIPLSTAQDRLFRSKTVSGDYAVSVIYASVADEGNSAIAQQDIAALLRERRGISYLSDDNFTIFSQNDLISVFGGILGALTAFIGAIAGISLLVGGIGIMNIMLVSVTERTREIGLRKAVGAKRSDVLIQFLVEAVVLAVLGGSIGIALGVAGATGISGAIEAFDAVVGLDAVLTALIFSTVVGVFFGIYPAYRASRLNPIDALRYE